MSQLWKIDNELMKCKVELAKWLMGEEGQSEYVDDPVGVKRWWEKYLDWEQRKKEPDLLFLYTDYITSPTHSEVIRYVGNAFKGSRDYRRVVINFIGNDVQSTICKLFVWYYVKTFSNESIYSARWFGSVTEKRFHDGRTQFYFKYQIREGNIDLELQITWKRPKEKVLDVIFTCNDDLFNSDNSWDELKRKCIP